MKKCFLLFFILFFSLLSFTETRTQKSEEIFYHDYLITSKSKCDQVNEFKLKRQYFERKLRQKKNQEKALSLPKGLPVLGVNGVQLKINSNTINTKTDYQDNLVIMGACSNTGSSSAVYLWVIAKLYDHENNLIGSEDTYVVGGMNVKLSSGVSLYALRPGDEGYFLIWTEIDSSTVSRYSLSFSYQSLPYSSCGASLSFVGSPRFSSNYGNLEVSGSVRNTSSNYVTYYNYIDFAIFDKNGKIQDVSFALVDGEFYDFGTDTTDDAIFPGSNASFDDYFVFASYSDFYRYESFFEWSEDYIGDGNEKSPPFGSFDTPANGSTVAGSVAVTGWALDDSGVDNVKIYRKSGGKLVFIGDAIFVEGARPDVAQKYPGYPDNTRAGWGYMMLTNFLPNNGNGTFELHAIATDLAGKKTNLGTSTIYCDNAHATKPFGAIDSPQPGATVSGVHRVKGWVLTPPPNKIPENGKSIRVRVDGVDIGHAKYNIYRSDIATLFPNYTNSKGAAAYFDLDTTTYSDGVHTLEWFVTDNAGNRDGVGSRYFSIKNENGGGGDDIRIHSLSSSNGKPFSLLTIQTSGIDPDAVIAVRFSNSSGYANEVKALETALDSVTVPIPPYINPGNNAISGGVVEIQLIQESDSGTELSNKLNGFSIKTLPETNGPPGRATLFYIESLQYVAMQLQDDPECSPELSLVIDEQLFQLQELFNLVEKIVNNPSKKIDFGSINDVSIAIGKKEIIESDRMILGVVAAIGDVVSSADSLSKATSPFPSALSASSCKNRYDILWDCLKNGTNCNSNNQNSYAAFNSACLTEIPGAFITASKIVNGVGGVAIGVMVLAGAPVSAIALPTAALLYYNIVNTGILTQMSAFFKNVNDEAAKKSIKGAADSLNDVALTPIKSLLPKMIGAIWDLTQGTINVHDVFGKNIEGGEGNTTHMWNGSFTTYCPAYCDICQGNLSGSITIVEYKDAISFTLNNFPIISNVYLTESDQAVCVMNSTTGLPSGQSEHFESDFSGYTITATWFGGLIKLTGKKQLNKMTGTIEMDFGALGISVPGIGRYLVDISFTVWK